MTRSALFAALTFVAVTLVGSSAMAQQPTVPQGKRLMYTTYFYTAAEAVIHGYEQGTKVRIVSMESKRTVWKGKVGAGETKLIPTGRGVFSFLADKKASILVGTPSACTAVACSRPASKPWAGAVERHPRTSSACGALCR